MDIRTSLDYSKVPVGRECTVRLMVSLQRKEAPQKERPPLNLSLILDHSGSMAGAKLDRVKQAAKSLVERLGGDDIFSLTLFENQVSVPISPTPVCNQGGALTSLIDSIRTGGMTNLSGGYERGCDLALQFKEKDGITRAILLTDGLANVGITDPARLGSMAAALLEKGITTSTIGVGDDYSEELLGEMATKGGGGAYFIEKPEDAVSVFQEELGNICSLAATGCRVSFTSSLSDVSQLNTYAEIAPRTYLLGDIYSNQTKVMVLELRLPAFENAGPIDIGRICAEYMEQTENGVEAGKAELPVRVEVVSESEFAATRPDREVTLHAAYLTVSAAKTNAIRLADSGGFVEASDLLRSCADELERLGLNDALLTKQIEDLRERAANLRARRERFYTASERKRMYHEGDMLSKSKLASYSKMLGRRGKAPDHSPKGHRGHGATYPCYLENGHILAEIGNERLLVDTGANYSIGTSKQLTIDGQMFDLADNYLGHTIEDLSALVQTMLTGIMGSDVFGAMDVLIDLPTNQIRFSGDSLDLLGAAIPGKYIAGVPVIRAVIGGEPIDCFVDTGARISYAHSSVAANAPISGEDTDFYPGFGQFKTPTLSLPVMLSGLSFNMRFGRLPQTLDMVIGVAGVKAILGAELILNRPVLFSRQRKMLVLG